MVSLFQCYKPLYRVGQHDDGTNIALKSAEEEAAEEVLEQDTSCAEITIPRTLSRYSSGIVRS